MKKKILISGIVIVILFILEFLIIWCSCGGELTNHEFQPDYIEETNPILRQEAVEKYNMISGTIVEMEPGGRDHWDLTIESPSSGFKWITVYTTKKYARHVNIGDYITVRGDFHYHRHTGYRGDVYESLSVGQCIAGPPLTFHAQIISCGGVS